MNRQLITYKLRLPVQTNWATSDSNNDNIILSPRYDGRRVDDLQ